MIHLELINLYMKILITHIDLDGYGGNILERLYHDQLNFDLVLNKNYGFESDLDIKQYINSNNDILIMDLSIPEGTFIEWSGILKSLHVLDHHNSSEFLSKYSGNVWDTSRCGTKLFYEEYVLNHIHQDFDENIKNNIKRFVDIVDTYDRWQENSELWESAKRLMKVNMGFGSDFVDHMVFKLQNNSPDRWDRRELKIIKEKEDIENTIISDISKNLQIRTDNSGYKFTINQIDYTPAVSICCSRFLDQHPEIDYIIIYNKWAKKMSWRTKKDIDLTQIHGVNGHKQAAGSEGGKSLSELVQYGRCPRWVTGNERKCKNVIVEKIRAK